jgi:ABC-2 type transport system permease protein
MSNGRLMRAYLIEAKYECIRTLRNPAFGVPFFVLPWALYLLFAVLFFGDDIRRTPYATEFLYVGFSVFGVMGPGMFGFGVSVAIEREQGLLTFKRALPMPPPAYLISKMLMAMAFAGVVMTTMVLAADFAAHLSLHVSQLLLIAGILVVGSLPFCAIGLFIGTRASGKSSPAFVNLLFLPMIYLSGLMIPMPKSMQWISRFSPAFYLDHLALGAVGLPHFGSPALDVAVLGGVTVAFALFAVRRLVHVR